MSVSLRHFYEKEGEHVHRYSDTSFWVARYHNKRKAYNIDLINSDKQADSLLDVGCGTGEYLLFAINTRVHDFVVGVDFSSSYLKRINSAGKKLHLILADARSLPFQAHSIDTVLCVATLEHIPNWTKVLRELCRVARNRIVLEVPNAGIVRWLAKKMFPTLVNQLDARVGHLHIFPLHIWQSKITNVTETLSHIDTVHIFPPIISHVLQFPPQLAKLVTYIEALANKILPFQGNMAHFVFEFQHKHRNSLQKKLSFNNE